MNSRQQKIFTTIIKEYIKTAEPIGSQTLLEKAKLNLSSATIRNEMALLEKQGFIESPHTSAGRVPTELGYQFYIDNFLQTKKLPCKTEKALQRNFNIKERADLKILAKELSAVSDLLIFLAFDKNDIYYTGLTNLFSQPEFSRQELICDITRLIDHFDDVIHDIFEQINDDIHILIGRQNPFSQECSAVIASYVFDSHESVLGIIGPMRMDYEQNVALVETARSVLVN